MAHPAYFFHLFLRLTAEPKISLLPTNHSLLQPKTSSTFVLVAGVLITRLSASTDDFYHFPPVPVPTPAIVFISTGWPSCIPWHPTLAHVINRPSRRRCGPRFIHESKSKRSNPPLPCPPPRAAAEASSSSPPHLHTAIRPRRSILFFPPLLLLFLLCLPARRVLD